MSPRRVAEVFITYLLDKAETSLNVVELLGGDEAGAMDGNGVCLAALNVRRRETLVERERLVEGVHARARAGAEAAAPKLPGHAAALVRCAAAHCRACKQQPLLGRTDTDCREENAFECDRWSMDRWIGWHWRCPRRRRSRSRSRRGADSRRCACSPEECESVIQAINIREKLCLGIDPIFYTLRAYRV